MTTDGAPAGRFAENLLHFGRMLRASGLPIGSDRILDAVRTLEIVGLTRRDDVYWALHAVFVSRGDQSDVFERAFALFWREPEALERSVAAMPPGNAAPDTPEQREPTHATHGAAGDERGASVEPTTEGGALTYSARESLRQRNFAEMSADELQRTHQAIARMRLPIAPLPTRRMRADPRGARVDQRATLRAGLRAGGDDLPLRWRSPRLRPPKLVVLCDISGSMDRYAGVLLQFLHVLSGQRKVEAFLFGTRLTRVTRALSQRDPNRVFDELGRAVRDWSGGTRIGACLREFNRSWSRRVLAQGAAVLLITDGLDRDGGQGLAREAERLQKSCRRLLWLNPLLGFDDFEAKASGIRALLPHVDEFLPVHNLASLEALGDALARVQPPTAPRASRSRAAWDSSTGRSGKRPA